MLLAPRRKDHIDGVIARDERIRKIETRYPEDLLDRAKVKQFKDIVLQWLYRRSGGMHPTQGLSHGGAYLWEQEQNLPGGSLSRRIRRFSAHCGCGHDVMRGRGEDGLWYSHNSDLGLMGLAAAGGNLGMDGGGAVEGGVVVAESPPQAARWRNVRFNPEGQIGAGDYGVLNQPTVQQIRIPAGYFLGGFAGAIPQPNRRGGGPPVGSSDNEGGARWSRELIQQTTAGDIYTNPSYNPYGSGSNESEGFAISDEIGEGKWGFVLTYDYKLGLGTGDNWRYFAPFKYPGSGRSYEWFGGVMVEYGNPEFTTLKGGVRQVIPVVNQDGSDGGTDMGFVLYDWISEVSPAFDAGIAYDAKDGEDEDGGDVELNVNFGTRFPPHNIVESLVDDGLARFPDVNTWLWFMFQQWKSGTSQGARRKENLWKKLDLDNPWRGYVQALTRQGWTYLRGYIYLEDKEDYVSSLVTFSVTGDPAPAPLTVLAGPANELSGLYAIQEGGAHAEKPIRLWFNHFSTGVQYMQLNVDNFDFADRRRVRLDGVSWQHVSDDNPLDP